MRVLFLSIDLFGRGGIQRYSRYELRELHHVLETGDLKVCSFTRPGADAAEDPPAVDLVGTGASIVAKLRFALSVWRLARRHRAQLIICDHIQLSPIAYAYRLLTRTPYWLNVYAIEVWRRLPRRRRLALIGAERVVSDCLFTKQFLERRYPRIAERLRIICDCVDCEQFTPAGKDGTLRHRLGLHGEFVVLTVSRLVRSKGHEAVMEALLKLRAHSIFMKYLVIGDGPDRPRLEAVARQRGVQDSVQFVGSLPERDLPAAYRLCDVFVLVSAFALDDEHPQGEGVPLVVLEAAACGKPAIASRKDGSAECIIDGVTGILVDPDDPLAIAEALKQLLGDSELRARMGNAARQHMERTFSFDKFATKVRATLTELDRSRMSAESVRAPQESIPHQ